MFEKYQKTTIENKPLEYIGEVQISKSWLWKPLKILSLVVGMILLFFLVFNGQFIIHHPPHYNSAAKADLRNAATAQEAYFVDNQTYSTSTDILIGATYGLYLNEGVTIEVMDAGHDFYIMKAFHSEGDKMFNLSGPQGTIEWIVRGKK
ncbi:hypothetical protein N9174_01145 [bacterium]|nr:hypothetical protein [bacterium]